MKLTLALLLVKNSHNEFHGNSDNEFKEMHTPNFTKIQEIHENSLNEFPENSTNSLVVTGLRIDGRIWLSE
jgi:hypothetical protein